MSVGESQPFDAFEMDDLDPDRPGSGGGGRLPEGGYKFQVTEVILQNEKGSTQVECEVIEAKDKNLIGRKRVEYLRWPKPEYSNVGNRIAKEQLLAWCYACKTTSPEEVKARQRARQGFDTRWLEAMVGRQLLGYVKLEEYADASGTAKTSAKCEGRVWAIDDPKHKEIPGWIPAPAAAQAGTPVAAVPPTTAPQPASPQPAANPFAGLV